MTKAAKTAETEEPPVVFGDNKRIKAFVERLRKLTEERNNINSDIKGVYDEAKNNGVDRKALKEVMKLDKAEVSIEHRENVNAYLEWIGKTPIYTILGDKK